MLRSIIQTWIVVRKSLVWSCVRFWVVSMWYLKTYKQKLSSWDLFTFLYLLPPLTVTYNVFFYWFAFHALILLVEWFFTHVQILLRMLSASKMKCKHSSRAAKFAIGLKPTLAIIASCQIIHSIIVLGHRSGVILLTKEEPNT